MELMGRAIRGGYAAYPNLEIDPLLQGIRAHPKYADLVAAGRRVQQDFVEYLCDSGRSPDTCESRFDQTSTGCQPVTTIVKADPDLHYSVGHPAPSPIRLDHIELRRFARKCHALVGVRPLVDTKPATGTALATAGATTGTTSGARTPMP